MENVEQENLKLPNLWISLFRSGTTGTRKKPIRQSCAAKAGDGFNTVVDGERLRPGFGALGNMLLLSPQKWVIRPGLLHLVKDTVI